MSTGNSNTVKITSSWKNASRQAALAAVLVLVLVPFAGIGAADPVDDAIGSVNDAACAVDEIDALLCTTGEVWVSRYDGDQNSHEYAYAMGVGPDGSTIFVTGRGPGANIFNSDYATVAYDASTGEQRWESRYDGPGTGHDVAQALGVSPDGSTVFVTGYSSTVDNSAFDYATVAYDAETGEEQWATRYDGPVSGDDRAWALGVSPDGSKVFVTGSSTTVIGLNNDYATVAYDAETGDELWLAQYSGPRSGSKNALALDVGPDGSHVYVTGQVMGTSQDFGTVAYDAQTGEELWAALYNGPGNRGDYAQAVGASPDGTAVFVTGYSWGTSQDYATVAYDAGTGDELWVVRYDGPDHAFALDLGVSPDGSAVFVTGQSTSEEMDYDYATVAYDAETGNEEWVARYDGPDNGLDSAKALVVGPDSDMVYVTGRSMGTGTDFDYATVAYSAETGSEQWLARYDESGTDHANALGLSPDGSHVYVTGQSMGDGTATDYATIAYGDAALGLPSLLPG